VLTVTASEFRSQLRNRVAAAERMSALLTAATGPPPGHGGRPADPIVQGAAAGRQAAAFRGQRLRRDHDE